ncbi:MAG TPA: hypothetical protein VFA39_15730 [Steroidobacteraceae bacterium]|nr:hypothetical protein [Steroidobacteraceae bacterium]
MKLPPKSVRRLALRLRSTLPNQETGTAVTIQQYAEVVNYLPPERRWTNRKLLDKGIPNVLFHGHAIYPSR